MERALYGLQTSPADWQEFRNNTFRELHWQVGCEYRALRQAISDASLWFVMAALLNENGVVEILNPEGEVPACMGVYVDDLLVSGPDEELDALREKLMSVWKTSNPSDIDHGMKFCGIEVDWDDQRNYLLHQTSYLTDLSSRYDLEKVPATLPDFKVGYEEPERVSVPILRKAQKLVGELLWLSGKTRVDVCYTVNKLGQYVSKNPSSVFQDGLRTLAYMTKASTWRLRYGAFGEQWEGEEPLRFPRTVAAIESWSDASFGQDDGHRSQSGILLVIAGGLIAWHSHRQSLTALSTAESEMISAVDSMTLARALSPIWIELCKVRVQWSLNVDNSACVQLLLFPSGAWRTRHLRLRAHHFREAIDGEALLVQHVPGSEMLSDLLTKFLSESRVETLMKLLGYVRVGVTRSTFHTSNVTPEGQSSHVCHTGPATMNAEYAARLLAFMLVASQAAGAESTTGQNVAGVNEPTGNDVLFVALVILCWEACKRIAKICCHGFCRACGWLEDPGDTVELKDGSQWLINILRSREIRGSKLAEQASLIGPNMSFGLPSRHLQGSGPQDYWEVFPEYAALVRWHVLPRQMVYQPTEFPLQNAFELTGHRRTVLHIGSESQQVIVDKDFRVSARVSRQAWTGRTEYEIKRRR